MTVTKEVRGFSQKALGIDLLPLKKNSCPINMPNNHQMSQRNPGCPSIHVLLKRLRKVKNKLCLYHNQCLKNQMLQMRPTDLLV